MLAITQEAVHGGDAAVFADLVTVDNTDDPAQLILAARALESATVGSTACSASASRCRSRSRGRRALGVSGPARHRRAVRNKARMRTAEAPRPALARHRSSGRGTTPRR